MCLCGKKEVACIGEVPVMLCGFSRNYSLTEWLSDEQALPP